MGDVVHINTDIANSNSNNTANNDKEHNNEKENKKWSFLNEPDFAEAAGIDQLFIAEDDITDPLDFFKGLFKNRNTDKPLPPAHCSTVFYDETVSDLLAQLISRSPRHEFTVVNVWGHHGVGKTNFSLRVADTVRTALYPTGCRTYYFPKVEHEKLCEQQARALNLHYPLLATPLDQATDIHALFWSHFQEHNSITVLDNIESQEQVYSLFPMLNTPPSNPNASPKIIKSNSSSSPGKPKCDKNSLDGSDSSATESEASKNTTDVQPPPSYDTITASTLSSTSSTSLLANTVTLSAANSPSNSFSLPPLAHSGRVASLNRALSKSSNLNATLGVLPALAGSGNSLKNSGNSSAIMPPRSPNHVSISGTRKLVIIVSDCELNLHESNGVGVIKVHLEGPSKALVQLAVRQMAPFLKPEETLAVVNLCNSNPKSLAALIGMLVHGECLVSGLTTLIQERENSGKLSVEESFKIGWKWMDQNNLQSIVCILASLFSGYFDTLAASHALKASYSDATKVLQKLYEIGFVEYHAFSGYIMTDIAKQLFLVHQYSEQADAENRLHQLCTRVITIAKTLLECSTKESMTCSLVFFDRYVDVITNILLSLKGSTSDWVRMILTHGRDLFGYRLHASVITSAYFSVVNNFGASDWGTDLIDCSNHYASLLHHSGVASVAQSQYSDNLKKATELKYSLGKCEALLGISHYQEPKSALKSLKEASVLAATHRFQLRSDCAIAMGQVYLRGGVSKSAINKMTEGVELARTGDNLPALASHLFLLASTLARLKLNEDSCQKFIECRDLAKTIGNRIIEEKALFFLGSLTTEVLASSRYFEECLSLCKSFRDSQRDASRFYDMGSFRSSHGEHTEAISLFSTAIDAAEAAGLKDMYGKALMAKGVALSHFNTQAESDQATSLLAKALTVFKEINDVRGTSACLLRMAAISSQKGDNPSTFYNEAATLAKGAGIKNVVGSALFGLGHASGFAGDEEGALKTIEKSIRIATELKDTAALAVRYDGLGQVRMKRGEYIAANNAFKTALTHAQAVGDSKLVVRIKLHISGLLRSKGDLQSALNLLTPNVENRKSKTEALAGIACLGAELGQRDNTMDTVKILAEESQESSNLQSLDGAKIYHTVASTFLYLGDITSAIKFLEIALTMSRKYLQKSIQGEIFSDLIVAEAHHNNKIQAKEYFDKIFKLLPDISDLSSQQYIFSNVVLYITILMDISLPYLEKVEQLGISCLKRAQTSGNELVLANVNLSLGILTTHLVTLSSTALVRSPSTLARSSSADTGSGMVRSASMSNLSHFQQIQQRKQLKDLEVSKAEGEKSSAEDLLRNARNLTDSIGYIHKAIEGAQKIGDLIIEGRALIAEGNAQYAMGDSEKARAAFKTAIELAQKYGNRRMEAHATVALAKTFSDTESALAIKMYKTAFGVCAQVVDRLLQSEVAMSLAQTVQATPLQPVFTPSLAVRHPVFASSSPNKPNTSPPKSLEEAISVLEYSSAQAPQFNMIRYGISLAVELAQCYISIGKVRQATHLLESACSLAKASDDSDAQNYCERVLLNFPSPSNEASPIATDIDTKLAELESQAIETLLLRDYRAHIRFCHEILSLLKLGGSNHAPSLSVLNTPMLVGNGSATTVTVSDSDSKSNFSNIESNSGSNKMEKITPSESLFAAQVDVMLRIIHAHILIGDLKGVKEVVEECVQLAQNLSDVNIQNSVLIAQGRFLLFSGDPMQGLQLLEEAVKMPGISNTSKGLSIAYLGAAYTFLGKNTDAVAQYESAIEFAKQNKDTILEVRVLTVKSQAFEKKKDIIGSIRALDDANQLLQDGQDRLLSADSEINLAQMYSKMGNRYRAVEIYKKLIKIIPNMSTRIRLMPSLYKRAGEELRMLGKTKQSITMYKKAFLVYKSNDDYHGQAISLTGIAKALLLREEFEKMADLCRKCMPITQSVGDKVLEADLVNMLGTYYMEMGQTGKATEHFEVALDLSRTGGNQDSEAKNMKSLGEVNHSQGAYHYALDLYNKALAIVKTTGNSSLQGWVHHCIAKTADVIDEQAMSLTNFEKAIQISRQMSDKYAEAKLMYDMGLVLSKKAKYYKAIENFKHSLLILATTDNRALEIVAAKELGIAYRSVGDTNHSLEAFQKGLQSVQRVEDPEQEAEVLRQLGITYSSAGDRVHAIEIYVRSLRITRETGDRVLEAGILGSLGDEYMAVGERTKALECFESALGIFDTLPHRQGRANAMVNLAEACLTVMNVKRAQELCELSLPLAVSTGDRRVEARAIMVMGRVYQLTAPTRALRHFEQAIAISRETKERATEAWCTLHLAHTYLSLQDPRAFSTAQSALNMATDLNLVALKCKALLCLGILHSSTSDFLPAIETLAEGMKLSSHANIKSTEADILYNLARCYESAQNFQLAHKFYNRANRILEKADDIVLHARVLAGLGIVCGILEKYDDSCALLLRSIPILEKLGDRLAQVQGHTGLGEAYSQQGKRQQAISSFRQALSLIPMLGEDEALVKYHVANLHCLLGWESLLLGKTSSASDFIEKAIAYSNDNFVKCNAVIFLVEVHLVLGPNKLMDYVAQATALAKLTQDQLLNLKASMLLARAHLIMGRPADATKVLESVLGVCRSQGYTNTFMEASCLCFLGEAYSMLTNYTQGIDVLEESLAIAKKKEYHLLQVHILARLGKIYCELRVHSLSTEYLEQCLTSLVHYPDKNAEAQAYIYLSETFSSEGHNLKAYELLRGAQGIAQETMNTTHLNLCKERIPKEFKKKEKNKKKHLSDSFRFEKEKERARERALGGMKARGSFILKKKNNRVGSLSPSTNLSHSSSSSSNSSGDHMFLKSSNDTHSQESESSPNSSSSDLSGDFAIASTLVTSQSNLTTSPSLVVSPSSTSTPHTPVSLPGTPTSLFADSNKLINATSVRASVSSITSGSIGGDEPWRIIRDRISKHPDSPLAVSIKDKDTNTDKNNHKDEIENIDK